MRDRVRAEFFELKDCAEITLDCMRKVYPEFAPVVQDMVKLIKRIELDIYILDKNMERIREAVS